MLIATLKYPLTFSSFLPLLAVWSLSDVPDRTHYTHRTFASLQYRTQKIDFPPSPGSYHIIPAAFYEGIVSRYTASESLYLRTETCFVMFVRRVKISACIHVLWACTPILAPPPMHSWMVHLWNDNQTKQKLMVPFSVYIHNLMFVFTLEWVFWKESR